MNLPSNFQPMLAATIEESDLDNLKYPVIVQPKLDGIRCIVADGVAYSRRLKLIPNLHISRVLELELLIGEMYDGELILKGGATFQDVASGIMTQEGIPDFEYVIFDTIDNGIKYSTRYNLLRAHIKEQDSDYLSAIYSVEVDSADELRVFETEILEKGYEGIIIRDPNSPYKFGRSTKKEGYLLKLKRFEDAEAEVIGVETFYHNANPLEYNELGYAKHSAHNTNLIPLGKLGALIVRGTTGQFKGVEFNVGSGFTDEQRRDLWSNLEGLKRQIITYKYQKVGSKDKPRCPIFKGFRKD